MSHISENIAWQLQDLREKVGTTVEFQGTEYRVLTEEVSGAKVGVQALDKKDTLGPYIASADPRVFRFNPAHFLPIIRVLLPIEGDELIWHRLIYVITLVNYSDVGEDTTGINVYAYRKVV